MTEVRRLDKKLKNNKILIIIAAAAIVIAGTCYTVISFSAGKAISVIGGADGPTSIFLAGRVGGASLSGCGMILAIVVILLLAFVGLVTILIHFVRFF